MDLVFLVLVLLLVALQVGDVVTTVKVLDRGGREMNPLVRLSMRLFGSRWIGLVVPKLLLVFVVIFLATAVGSAGWAAVLIIIPCAMHGWAVVNNLRVLRS